MSHTLDELMRDSLDHCVKCTICETYCPVAAATPLFPGPKYVGPQAERYRGPGPSPDVSLDYCSSCGICTQVCPQGVKIAEINSQARARLKEDTGVPLRDRLIARPTLSGPARHPGRADRQLGDAQPRRAGPHREGDRDPPQGAPSRAGPGAPYTPWRGARARRRKPDPAAPRARSSTSTAAGPTTTSPTSARMAVAVLEHNGLQVIMPKQGCCGLPLQSNGLFDDARGYVRRLAAAPRALRAGRARHRGHLDELRPDAEAGGPRDPRGRGRRPSRRSASTSTTSASTSVMLHERGELDTDFSPLDDGGPVPRPLPAAGPRHRHAGDGADGAHPGAARRARSTRSAAASPAPTG